RSPASGLSRDRSREAIHEGPRLLVFTFKLCDCADAAIWWLQIAALRTRLRLRSPGVLDRAVGFPHAQEKSLRVLLHFEKIFDARYSRDSLCFRLDRGFLLIALHRP